MISLSSPLQASWNSNTDSFWDDYQRRSSTAQAGQGPGGPEDSPAFPTAATVRLASILFGPKVSTICRDVSSKSPGAIAVAQHAGGQLQLQLKPILTAASQALGLHSSRWGPDELVSLACSVIEGVSSSRHRGCSIDDVVAHLFVQYDCPVASEESDDFHVLRQLVFCIVGILTTSYAASALRSTSQLSITQPSIKGISHYSQRADNAARPIWALLGYFGDVLPPTIGTAFAEESAVRGARQLYASRLNFYALRVIGRIRITWVEHIGAHLEFDQARRELMLYRYPTYCALAFTDNDHASFFASCLDNYLLPPKTSAAFNDSLHREILLSYRLIFAATKKARRWFQREELQALQSTADWDPLLLKLCTEPAVGVFHPSHVPPARDAYSNDADFPIFGARLEALQAYMDRQDPSQIRDMWRDRRSVLQWYTFWSVLVFGSISIVLSLLQVVLGILQVWASLR